MPESAELNQHQKAAQTATQPPAPADLQTDEPEKKSGRKFIVIAVVLFLAVVAGLFYWHSTF